jgi:hypothetical protein
MFYPDAPEATNPNPAIPTGQELLDLRLEGFFEVAGDPTLSFVITPTLNENDWLNTGTPAPFYVATGRVFILLREGEGTITNITNVASGLSQWGAFEPYSVIIDGIKYNGIMNSQSVVWSGTTQYRVSVSATPTIPKNFRSTSASNDSVTLEWDATNNTTGYEVRYRKSDDAAWTSVSVSGTEKTITGLAADTSYAFQVRAVNDKGESPWSVVVKSPETPPTFFGSEVVWGMFYPDAPEATNPNPAIPTGQELLDLGLEHFYEMASDSGISGFTILPRISETDWEKTGTPAPLYVATGRVFVLIREGEGTITDITNPASGLSQWAAFKPYSVIINDIRYNGVMNTQSFTWSGAPVEVFVNTT